MNYTFMSPQGLLFRESLTGIQLNFYYVKGRTILGNLTLGKVLRNTVATLQCVGGDMGKVKSQFHTKYLSTCDDVLGECVCRRLGGVVQEKGWPYLSFWGLPWVFQIGQSWQLIWGFDSKTFEEGTTWSMKCSPLQAPVSIPVIGELLGCR